MTAVGLVAFGGLLLLISEEAESQAIIDNGVIQVGVTAHGAMNIYGGSTSCSGTWATGVRYMPTNCDATAAGCLCEGWGAAYDGSLTGTPDTAGWCNVSVGGCPGSTGAPISSCGFTSTASTAVSCTEFGSLEVIHDWHPNPLSPNLYTADVTLTNIGSSTIDHVMYRRAMDWDIEPTPFNEYSTIGGVSPISPKVVDFGNNGFRSVDIVSGWGGPGMGTCPVYLGAPPAPFFADCGPRDHGAQFTFDLGALPPGKDHNFRICYGADKDETGAMTLVSACAAELYALGQTSYGSTSGAPNTFFFGFNGIDPEPVADFTWLPALPCHDDLVEFTDLSESGAPWTRLVGAVWDFGDGTTPTYMTGFPANITHDFPGPGIYNVTLRVIDDEGAFAETYREVTICNEAPTLAGPDEVFVEVGRPLVFSLRGSDPNGDPVSLAPPAVTPSGMDIDAASGRIHWVPGASYITYPGPPMVLTFTASDPWGKFDPPWPSTYEKDVKIHVLPYDVPPPSPLDSDRDGLPDDQDNCPQHFNPDQKATGSGEGIACALLPGGGGAATEAGRKDPSRAGDIAADAPTPSPGEEERIVSLLDSDKDGLLDRGDNCVYIPNPLQRDLDDDGIGDDCDADIDGDGIHQTDATGRMWDNCPYTPNVGQEDSDGDGIGDACQNDPDGDLVPTLFDGIPYDNCPATFNPDQRDTDGDGKGDACDGTTPIEQEADIDAVSEEAAPAASLGTTGVVIGVSALALVAIAALVVLLLVRRR